MPASALRVLSDPASGEPGVWQLALLGAWSLRRCGRPECLPVASQRVLAFIALNHPCGRAQLAGSLWPTVDERRALGNLRSVLWRLSRSAPDLLMVAGQMLSLAENVAVDVREFDAVWGQTELVDHSRDYPHLFSVELLPGWYDDWVLAERERLRQLRLHALEDRAIALCQRHCYGEALQAALRVLSCEPLRESAHRLVIQIHLAEGNVSEAARQYSACRQMLWEELGVRPSRLLRQLDPAAMVSD